MNEQTKTPPLIGNELKKRLRQEAIAANLADNPLRVAHINAGKFLSEWTKAIMDACKWDSQTTFYNKVNGLSPINIWEREQIETVAEKFNLKTAK